MECLDYAAFVFVQSLAYAFLILSSYVSKLARPHIKIRTLHIR